MTNMCGIAINSVVVVALLDASLLTALGIMYVMHR